MKKIRVAGFICLLIMAVLGQVNAAGCYVLEQQGSVIAGNDFFALKFEPKLGGAITSIKYDGKEMVANLPGEGVLQDSFAEERSAAEFQKKPYRYEILKQDPNQVVIHLWATGERGNMQFVEYHKTVTITSDRSNFRVGYEIKNRPESMMSLTLSPWSHNLLGISNEECSYFFPTAAGIAKVKHNKLKPQGNYYVTDPSRAWSGFVSDKGTGMVCLSDYRYLSKLYNCFGAGWATVEWSYGQVTIPTGDSFKTTYWYFPFSDMQSINGATSDVVASMQIANGSALVKLASGREFTGRVDIGCRLLPDEKMQVLKSETLHFQPNKTLSVSCPVSVAQNGTYAISVFVKEGDKQVGEAETPYVNGSPTAQYALLPVEKKLIKDKNIDYVPFVPTGKVVTPGINWAQPYYKGRTKGLFLVWAAQEREVVELAQRMDLDYVTSTLTFWNYEIGWYPASSTCSKGFKEAGALLDGDYDFILISGSFNPSGWARNEGHQVQWDYFDSKTQDGILDKVAKGAGLIYIYPLKLSGQMEKLYKESRRINDDEYKYLLDGVPELPALNGAKIKISQYEQGCVIFLDYPGQCLTPEAGKNVDYNYYDYFHSFLAKTVLWVTNRQPDIAFNGLAYSNSRLDVTLDNKGAEKNCTLEMSICDASGKSRESASIPGRINHGANSFKFDIPVLPAGKYFANCYVKSKEGKIIDWATKEITVKSAAGIAEVSLDGKDCRKEGTLSGKVFVRNYLNRPEKYTLSIAWEDIYGRIMQEQRSELIVPASGGASAKSVAEYKFQLPVKHAAGIYNKVVVSLLSDGKLLDSAKKAFFLSMREWDDYKVILWDGSDNLPEFLGYGEGVCKSLRDIGVDTLDVNAGLVTDTQAVRILANNMSLFSVGLNRFNLEPVQFKEAEQTLVRKPCLSDPAYRQQLESKLCKRVGELAPYGMLGYSIGDENSLTSYTRPLDICFSPTCLAAFRDYLRGQYGSLQALNDGWGTSFSAWDEVKPFTSKEIIDRASLNFSPWADHRSFMDSLYADTLAYCRTSVKEADPDAKVGECGTNRQSAYGGHDWYKKMQVWDFVQPYYIGHQLDMNRSFSQVPIAGWAGFGSNENEFAYNIWKGLMHGAAGASIFYTPLCINPDFTLTQLGSSIKKYIGDEIKTGVGKLLISSNRLDDGIAIHYSQPSCQAAWILKKPFAYNTEDEYDMNMDGTCSMLEDLGLQYKFVASEQIENGDLLNGNYKVLILPLSRAISEKEAAQIRKFVQGGGLVLADCQTGIFNQHLKPYSKPVLDDLFGIQRPQNPAPLKNNLTMNYGNLSMQVGACDNIKTGTASAATVLKPSAVKIGSFNLTMDGGADVPAVMVNKVGRGKSVYLNFLTDYDNSRKVLREEQKRAIIGDILCREGISPRVSITSIKTGKGARCVETAFFGSGGQTYLGVLRDIAYAGTDDSSACSERVKINLPSACHVYDIRNKSYLGLAKTIETNITPGVALLYGLLPYKIDGLNLSIRQSCNPGEVVDCKISVKPKGDYIVRVEVVSPDGTPAEWFSRNLKASAGYASMPLALARNEKSGLWTLKATEVISGKSCSVQFRVK